MTQIVETVSRERKRRRCGPSVRSVKGPVDRMSAGREDPIALLTKRGVHIPRRELDFGHTAVQTSSAPRHLLSRMSTRLLFRNNAAL